MQYVYGIILIGILYLLYRISDNLIDIAKHLKTIALKEINIPEPKIKLELPTIVFENKVEELKPGKFREQTGHSWSKV